MLLAAILASSMAFIDGSALNVALPALQADLGATGGQVLWIVNAYLLMLAALILVGGALGDRLGRRRVFTAGIALFLVASLACGLAPTAGVLIVARVVQGIGGALMIPGSLAIISAAYDSEGRGRAIGTWSAVTTLVTIAGPVLGGLLADAGLWRGVFLINLPLGALALAATILRVPESRDTSISGSIDYPGAALAAVGLGGLTYGFIAAPEAGFASPTSYLPIAGGAAALAAFVVVEARSPAPMLPLGLFSSRTFSGANLLTLFLYGALSVGPFFFSLNLVRAQGYSQSAAGLAFTPFAVVLALLSRRAGALADRYGPRLPLIGGPALAGLGFLLLALPRLTDGPASYWTTYLPGVMVLGLGMAATVAPLTSTVMGAVAQHYAGTASGINNAVARAAGVLAIAIVGAVALLAFAAGLDARTAGLPLPPEAREAIRASASSLGAAPVPAEVPAGQVEEVRLATRGAFADAHRLVQITCAALAWLSAAMAALLIDRGRPAHGAEPSERLEVGDSV